MNIIYIAKCCSKEKFSKLQESGINRDVPQAQKYHRLMIEGLSENRDDKVTVISAIPTNRKWSRKVFFSGECETIGQVKYQYVPFVNLPILRQISLYFETKKALKKAEINNHTIFICDIWHFSMASAARKIGNSRHINTIGIFTDVPGHRSDAYKDNRFSINSMIKALVEKRTINSMSKYDGYLLLTKQMNDVVNLHDKPYLVLEGHADVNMERYPNNFNEKANPKIMMYAGTLHREYGIAELVEAFIESKHDGWEFHIYGKGNYSDELNSICENYKEVIYKGLKPNDIVIQEQIKASLIVNPRPTKADFVNYSFPSKTLEAMVSGTPLLTTRLPGIPDDYNDYVYYFDEENPEAYRDVLNMVLNLNEKELYEKGINARQYVLSEKTNIKQAQKLRYFILQMMDLN